MSVRLALAALAVAAAFAALVAVLVPNPGSRAPRTVPSLAAHAVHADGIAVSSTLDESAADEAFLADLFDGQATEVSAQQQADLVAIGHRICDLAQPRAEWLASLTAAGPHAYTADEAGKILDTAHAAYCPEQSAPVAVVAAPAPTAHASTVHAAPRTSTRAAAPSTAPAHAPAATVSTPAVAPSAATETQEQLPEEQIGRAIDCPNGTVGHVVDADGRVDC